MRLLASYDSRSMKPAIRLLCAMMLCGMPCASLQAQAPVYNLPQQSPTTPPGPVPIGEEPHHRLLLQNDFTHVYIVMVPPLDATLLAVMPLLADRGDRESTRLNSSHGHISHAGLCLE